MKKHPSCYILDEPLKSVNAQAKSEAVVIYDGRFYNQGLSAEHAQIPQNKICGEDLLWHAYTIHLAKKVLL